MKLCRMVLVTAGIFFASFTASIQASNTAHVSLELLFPTVHSITGVQVEWLDSDADPQIATLSAISTGLPRASTTVHGDIHPGTYRVVGLTIDGRNDPIPVRVLHNGGVFEAIGGKTTLLPDLLVANTQGDFLLAVRRPGDNRAERFERAVHIAQGEPSWHKPWQETVSVLEQGYIDATLFAWDGTGSIAALPTGAVAVTGPTGGLLVREADAKWRALPVSKTHSFTDVQSLDPDVLLGLSEDGEIWQIGTATTKILGADSSSSKWFHVNCASLNSCVLGGIRADQRIEVIHVSGARLNDRKVLLTTDPLEPDEIAEFTRALLRAGNNSVYARPRLNTAYVFDASTGQQHSHTFDHFVVEARSMGGELSVLARRTEPGKRPNYVNYFSNDGKNWSMIDLHTNPLIPAWKTTTGQFFMARGLPDDPTFAVLYADVEQPFSRDWKTLVDLPATQIVVLPGSDSWLAFRSSPMESINVMRSNGPSPFWSREFVFDAPLPSQQGEVK